MSVTERHSVPVTACLSPCAPLSGILQAGTKDVDHIIDNEEAVVITLAYIYYNRCILLVMTLHVELLLLRELAGVDGACQNLECAKNAHCFLCHIRLL